MFLSRDNDFKDQIYHVHTGAHCTSDGKIGTAQPQFSLFDMQKIFDASLKAGVMQINNQANLPRYEWSVYYIDAMCYSNTYQPQIPSAQKLKLNQLSPEAQTALFRAHERR